MRVHILVKNDIHIIEISGNVNSGAEEPLIASYGKAGTEDSTSILFNFNENGDIKWIKKIPAADAMFTALGNDSIYLILCVESDNSNYTSEGLTDTLLIKLDQSGNQLWRKQFYKEAGNMIPSAAAVDSNGNVYITGKCDRGIQYTKADGIVVEKNYISGSLNDIYILKINTGGTAIWGEIIGDVYFNSIETFVSSGIIADNEGCIIHGQTDVDYDSEIAPDNKNNTFLMSFNADGTKNWTRYISNAANVEPTISSTAFDSSGNIVITGKVKTSSTVSLFGLPRISENDSFVAKYSRSGSRMSATFFGGKGVTTNSSDVNLSSSGVIYLFGSINGSLNGEPITGDRDYFLTNFYQF